MGTELYMYAQYNMCIHISLTIGMHAQRGLSLQYNLCMYRPKKCPCVKPVVMMVLCEAGYQHS